MKRILLSVALILAGLVSAQAQYIAPYSGAVSRTNNSKMADIVSVFDFIPVSLQAAIKAGTSTTDVSSYLATMQANVPAGVKFLFPAGQYNIGAGATAMTGRVVDITGVTFTGGGSITGASYSATSLANPSTVIGLTANNGSATTAMRSDGAPALDQAISPTWSGTHTFSNAPVFSNQSGTRTALGLGTAATQNTGTSGNTIPFLDGTNTWTGANLWTLTQTYGAIGGTSGTLILNGSTSGNATVTVAAAAGSSVRFQLPADNGTSGYVLSSDGSGNTSWIPATPQLATQTSAYLGRLSVLPNSIVQAFYDDAIKLLVNTGTWNKLCGLYFLGGQTTEASLTNTLSSSYNLTVTGSPVFAAGYGYTGTNANTDYLSTGFATNAGTCANWTQDTASIFAWKYTSPGGDNGLIAGTATKTFLQAIGGSSIFLSTANSSSYSTDTYTAACCGLTGLFAGSRTASNAYTSYQNGIVRTKATSVSSAPDANVIRFLSEGSGGTTAQLSLAGFGGALTDADIRNVYAAGLSFQNAVHGTTPTAILQESSDIYAYNASTAAIVPGIGRLCDGRVISPYSSGASTTDQPLVYKLSTDAGLTDGNWSSPTTLATPAAGKRYVNASVLVTSNCTILIPSSRVDTATEQNGELIIFRGVVAGDLSIAWTPITVTTTFGTGVYGTHSAAFIEEMSNGTLIASYYNFAAGNASAHVIFSSDDGVTWGSDVTAVPRVVAGDEWTEANYRQLSNGEVLGVVRLNNTGTPSRSGFWVVKSSDFGATWSTPNQVIADINIARPALALTPTGTIFLLSRVTRQSGSGSAQGYFTSINNGLSFSAVSYYYNHAQSEPPNAASPGVNYADAFYDTVTGRVFAAVGFGGFSAPSTIFFQRFKVN